MQATIERIEKHAKIIQSGEHESVRPGQPWEFSAACEPGDGCWQGDLGIEIVEAVPAGYVEVVNPTEDDRQLVPGNTEGSKHCLDSLSGVKMYRPEEWDEESLRGPCLVLTEERKVLHPTHGPVTVPAGLTILCRYQREWDKELVKERRTRD